jgi:hypothetical protein
MYRLRVLVVFLSTIALAVAAAGCGGDGGDGGDSASRTTPDAWAASVCGALGDWVADLQAESQELQPAMRNTRNLESVKEAFVTFIEDAEERFGEAVEKVEDVDAPDVPQGEAIHEDFVSALEDVEQSFSRAVDQANDLPTNDLQSFSTGVGELSQDVQENLAAAGQSFNSLSDRSTELESATDAEPVCQQFKRRS